MNTKKKLGYGFFLLLIIVITTILWMGIFRKKNVSPAQRELPPASLETANFENNKIFFATNGKDTAYKIKKGDRWSILWNGIESKDYDFVSNPVFSPDGSQIAFSAEVGDRAYVVVNNLQEINAYRKAGFIVFSQDGKTIAFVAAKDDHSYVTIKATVDTTPQTSPTDGEESKTYSKVGTIQTPDGKTVSIVFSPDGETIAYAAEDENGKVYIVINGIEGIHYDSITNFSLGDNGQPTYEAIIGDKVILVVDNIVVNVSTTPPNVTPANPPSDGTIPSPVIDENYKYKISTDKDIDRSAEGDLSYPACTDSECNF